MNQKAINFCPEEEINNKDFKAYKIQVDTEGIRNYNIRNSNYAKMPVGYQPWDI